MSGARFAAFVTVMLSLNSGSYSVKETQCAQGPDAMLMLAPSRLMFCIDETTDTSIGALDHPRQWLGPAVRIEDDSVAFTLGFLPRETGAARLMQAEAVREVGAADTESALWQRVRLLMGADLAWTPCEADFGGVRVTACRERTATLGSGLRIAIAVGVVQTPAAEGHASRRYIWSRKAQRFD